MLQRNDAIRFDIAWTCSPNLLRVVPCLLPHLLEVKNLQLRFPASYQWGHGRFGGMPGCGFRGTFGVNAAFSTLAWEGDDSSVQGSFTKSLLGAMTVGGTPSFSRAKLRKFQVTSRTCLWS